jgi:protease PrsW
LIAVLGAVAAGVGPAIFWLWFIWRRDRYDREPKLLLAATFAFGAISAIVAALLETLAGAELVGAAGIAGTALSAVFLVGPIEEGVKFGVVRVWAYPRRAFNEVMDGPVYAAAAATGFAGF